MATDVLTKQCLFDEHEGSAVCDIDDFYIGAGGRVSQFCKRCEKLRKRRAYWEKQGFDDPPSVDPVKLAMRERGLKLTDFCAVCYKPIDKKKHKTYCSVCTGKMQYSQRRRDRLS